MIGVQGAASVQHRIIEGMRCADANGANSKKEFRIFDTKRGTHKSRLFSDYNMPANIFNDNFAFTAREDAMAYAESLEVRHAAV